MRRNSRKGERDMIDQLLRKSILTLKITEEYMKKYVKDKLNVQSECILLKLVKENW